MPEPEPIRARRYDLDEPHNVMDSLADAFRGVPHLPGALCRGSDAWDADHDGEPESPAQRQTRLLAATQACERCPALAACRRWADSMAPRDRPLGVLAGQVYAPPTGHRHNRDGSRRNGALLAAAATEPVLPQTHTREAYDARSGPDSAEERSVI